VPAAFDRNGEIERQLREIAPDIVVDATAVPILRADPYRVVRRRWRSASTISI